MRRPYRSSTWCCFASSLLHHRCFCVSETRQPYRRRSSDPQTLREKGNFQRDLKFSKRRPLPDAPWLQDKKRTYLDDAERLYGRKETWQHIEDEAVREKLASLLQRYLDDMIDATKLEVRDARKYLRQCDQLDAEYRSCVIAAAFTSVEPLRTLAKSVCQPNGTTSSSSSAHCEDAQTVANPVETTGEVNDSTSQKESIARQEFAEARRRRGERAMVENTPATADLSKDEQRNMPFSAFPFLRQRALENESSLDPSLVDWTAKYFPEDDDRTFASPPKLRADAELEENSNESDSVHAGSSEALKRTKDVDSSFPKSHARLRLQRSLRLHEDMNRPSFDAEGVFYRIRRQGNEDDRAPKPKPVRGSDANRERDAEVVKVPWDIVAKAKEMGYKPDNLRAKERLIRLSRGEDPQTIP